MAIVDRVGGLRTMVGTIIPSRRPAYRVYGQSASFLLSKCWRMTEESATVMPFVSTYLSEADRRNRSVG